jgi:hypothetical protein
MRFRYCKIGRIVSLTSRRRVTFAIDAGQADPRGPSLNRSVQRLGMVNRALIVMP